MRSKKLAIVGLASLLSLALISFSCISVPIGNKIAVISLDGAIASQSSFFGSSITPELVKGQLDKAEKDITAKAIVLRVESPGGVVAPCQEILEEINKVKQSKPIVVSMRSMAASGGYYISAGADSIIALPGTLTGSIGVISQIPNVKGLYEKLGIEMQTFKGGKYKDMYSGFRELTSEENEIMQKMTDEYYEQFVEVVAEGRGLSKDTVRNLATGQLYTGVEAKKLGLVDELGGLDTAIAVAARLANIKTWQVEYYRPKVSFLESLLGMGFGSLVDVVQLKLLGLSGEDIVLLQTLSHAYPQPQFLYIS